MPVNANFGILQPVDVGGAFTQAFQQGKQQRAESETDAALAALAQNPNADISGLAKYNPQFVYKVNAQRRQQEQAAQQAQVTGDALTGNPQAREALAYFDKDTYLQLKGDERERAKEGLEAVANAALWADTPQKWDAIVGQIPGAEEYRGRFAERESIIAQAGEMKSLLDSQKPDIGYVPADSFGYAKNAAGEGVLQGITGQQAAPQQPNQGGGMPPTNPNPSAGTTVASSDQIAQVSAAFGGDPVKVQQWMQQNNVVEGKELNGQTYYKINGQWFDNPEGR